MGYTVHHAILVTSYRRDLLLAGAEQARALGLIVTGPSDEAINGFCTLTVCPDGSKEGWPESVAGDEARAAFVAWVESHARDDASTPLEWVLVAYGADLWDGDGPPVGGTIERHTRSLLAERRGDVPQGRARSRLPSQLEAIMRDPEFQPALNEEYAREIVSLQKQLARATALLQSLEWCVEVGRAGPRYAGQTCPRCRRYQHEGHNAACELAAHLREHEPAPLSSTRGNNSGII